jgi:hypothetical protein
MPEFSTLSKVAIAGAAFAASAGVAYFLFRKEEQSVATVSTTGASKAVEAPGKIDPSTVTVEKLLEIMGKIVAAQNSMKGVMKNITEEIKNGSLDFAAAYNLVKDKQPTDPMEDLGLGMDDFDRLLDKYQEDPRVLDAIARIMGPSEDEMAADDGKVLSVQELIEIHRFMLEELKQISGSMKKMSGVDSRAATATAQVLVGARVESNFKTTSTAVERSVMMHQNQLAGNHEFATINMMMQQAMTELMGDELIHRE